jgi:PAS domain S-box-containing protein
MSPRLRPGLLVLVLITASSIVGLTLTVCLTPTTLHLPVAASVALGAVGLAGLGGVARLSRRYDPPPDDGGQAKSALRPGEGLNQAVLNSLPAQVAVLDQNGDIIAVNEAWSRFTRGSRAPAPLRPGVGTNYVEASRQAQGKPARDTHAIALGLEAILERTQAEFTYEYPLPTPRKPRWFLLSAMPLTGERGGAVVSHLDITERKRAEKALLESQERFKRIAENAPDMIYRWTYARGYEYVSPACTEVSGYRPEQYYADPGLGYRIIHPDDLHSYEETISDLANPEGPRRYCVIRWFHKDGHIVHIEMRMTPLFDERDELAGLEGIVHDISEHVLARERLRELTTQITRAHEDERQRIARELHDEIGQALTIAKMRLRMAEGALPEQAGTAHERLEALNDLVEETLQNVRALSHELRPPLLDELGWEPALAWLCTSFSQRTGLAVGYRHRGLAGRLLPEIELTAYRAVQEALTNVIRHAGAQKAMVHAQLSRDALALTIQDDGRGFDVALLDRAGRPDVGLGLLGMQERVHTAGGEMQIDSTPGEGTTIRVYLPHKKAES